MNSFPLDTTYNQYTVIKNENHVPSTPDKNNTINNLTASYNISEKMSIETIRNSLRIKSVNKISHFMRKAIAAQCYASMFSHGTNFKKLGLSLPKNTEKSSFESLAHLDKVSEGYLYSIKEKIGTLSDIENLLLNRIKKVKFLLRHQSPYELVKNDKLSIFSNKKICTDEYLIRGATTKEDQEKLRYEDILNNGNTTDDDQEKLRNDDFVFFAIELLQEDESKHPLNSTLNGVDYGAYAYLVHDIYPYGYLTLTDHLNNNIKKDNTKLGYQDFISQFTEFKSEISRRVNGERGEDDVPIYNAKDMKEALGLHLIEFIRNSKDIEFRNFSLNKNLKEEDLDKLINCVFQPEFHLPRMISTRHYKKVKIRELSIVEAIQVSDEKKIHEYVKDKDSACSNLIMAVYLHKKKSVEILLDKWNFSISDVQKMMIGNTESGIIEMPFILSIVPKNNEILRMFLDRKLIDVNYTFQHSNKGLTMLDIAIAHNCLKTIDLLENRKALTGEQVSEKQRLADVNGVKE